MNDATGLAFSGGGIRSATFCLGVAQVLARRGLLGKFDVLSTVSGGGYCGSFIGKLFQQRGDPVAASGEIANNQSWPVRWLRESGYYLAPGGSADSWVILSLLLRNWLAIHVVLASYLLLPFLFAAAARRGLWNCPAWVECEKWFVPGLDPGVFAVSPWFVLLAAIGALMMFLPGALFWLTQWRALFGDVDAQEKAQSGFTRWLAFGAKLAAGVLLVAVMDTAASWIHHAFEKSPGVMGGFAAVYAAAAAGFGWVQKAAGKLSALAAKPQKNPSMWTIAKIAGFAWAALFWLLLAVAGQAVLWSGGAEMSDLAGLGKQWSCIAALAFGALIGVWLLAKVYPFVNLSSLHHFYSARLGRAYLGASNDERKSERLPVTEPHRSDDCEWRAYRPHEHGGPLHIINTTLNETVSGKSQIEQIDRKGLNFALGPAGLSASGGHHALWVSDPATPAGSDKIAGIALPVSNGKPPFAVFPAETKNVEKLWLSDWVGISGAAFSTGMGANTSVGLSLLLGFANVRLGYWWDSGIEHPSDANGNSRKLAELLARLFPAPGSLLDELLARFHGPQRRRWYLSDGGHFENTACYELIRRRVRFILCIDCGQDEAMTFEDMANLVRKARIDFGAEIEFVPEGEVAAALAPPHVPAEFATLNKEWIGLPDGFESLAAKDGAAVKTSGKCHALLARVFYDRKPGEPRGLSEPGTVIVFIKPTLTGDEPLDIRQYHSAQPSFPQQTTMDQFFDESQWESYRRLGEHIAESLIPVPAAPSAPAGATGADS
ncbi:MAG: hypothetical protein ABMA13_03600 [Chthoniobacteraceae bacterium]